MPFDPDSLLNFAIPEIEQTLTPNDCILYALGLGLGSDPMDADQLRYVYEEGLRALPTMAVVLAYPGFWIKDPKTGVDWVRVVHGEQGIEIHKPLPISGTLVGRSRITDIIDKGEGKGVLIYSERKVTDKASGDLLATLRMSTFARGDGGSGTRTTTAGGEPPLKPHAIPQRDPDRVSDLATLPQAALIYRLSGDYNPLHADPAVAKKAGFDRPILHGLCTLGVVGHALLKECCGYDPTRLAAMSLRFSAPVFPGETIRTEIWDEGNGQLAFLAKVEERGAVVINNGKATLRG